MAIRDPRPYMKAYVGQPYCYGMRGWLVTAANAAAKKKQYPGSAKNIPSEGPVNGTRIGLDCIGAICAACSVEKPGTVMGDSPKGMAYYAAKNGRPGNIFMDAVSAEGARKAWGAKLIASIPEPTAAKPGIAVFIAAKPGKSGHIGLYLGDGKVCESTPPRVQITELKKRRTAGGSTRQWESWAYIPDKWLEYADAKWGAQSATAPEKPVHVPTEGLQIGDRVRFKRTGIPYYPGAINIPAWAAKMDLAVDSAETWKGQVKCVRLQPINTWCDTENLVKVED